MIKGPYPIALGVSLVACALFAVLTVMIGSVTQLEKDQSAVAQSKKQAKSSAIKVALVCGALWCIVLFTRFLGAWAPWLIVLATAVGFTAASFFVSKLYFYRRYLKKLVGAIPTANKGQQQCAEGGSATILTQEKVTKHAVRK